MCFESTFLSQVYGNRSQKKYDRDLPGSGIIECNLMAKPDEVDPRSSLEKVGKIDFIHPQNAILCH